MKRQIKYNNGVATLSVSGQAAKLEFNARIDKMALLADAINDAAWAKVHHVLFNSGRILFSLSPKTKNSEIVEHVCDAITQVFNSEVSIGNAIDEDFV